MRGIKKKTIRGGGDEGEGYKEEGRDREFFRNA